MHSTTSAHKIQYLLLFNRKCRFVVEYSRSKRTKKSCPEIKGEGRRRYQRDKKSIGVGPFIEMENEDCKALYSNKQSNRE